MTNKTIFLDIDGTILKHMQHVSNILSLADTAHKQTILPDVLGKLNEWESKGYTIILITARKESMRKFTEEQLTSKGIFWDQLIMGIGNGPRHLVNDKKPDGTETAFAVNLDRNSGLSSVSI